MSRYSSKEKMSAPGKTSPEKLWLVLAKCYKSVSEVARRQVEDSGLGLSDFAVLEALLHKGPLTISAIGAKVLLTSGSMTAAVNRLEEKGLVRRKTDEADRRIQQVELTVKGAKLIQPVFAGHQKALGVATRILTQAERDQLAGLLKKLGLSTQELLEQTSTPVRAQRNKKRESHGFNSKE